MQNKQFHGVIFIAVVKTAVENASVIDFTLIMWYDLVITYNITNPGGQANVS